MRRLWNMTSRRIGTSLVVAVLTLCGLAAPAAATDQVPFNAEGTAVITAVTHLPGGLTQMTGSTSGNATHLGDFTGPITRIQDHQGGFGSTAVFVGANGTDSVFLTINGHFESPGGSCVVTSTGTYAVTGGKTGTTQLRVYFNLDDNNDKNADYIGYYSGDNGTAANRPQLVVTYQ